MEFVLLVAGLSLGLVVGFFIGQSSRGSEREREAESLLHFQEEAIRNLRNEFDRSADALYSSVKAATEEMLRRRQMEFAESSSERIDSILSPLNRSIDEMRRSIEANTLRHSQLGGMLDANLKALFSQTEAARLSADRLADALKGNNRVQGQWGEVVLKELLLSQGLKEGVHFDTQVVGEASLRPDLVLHLDESRDVLIDAKVSLTAFLDYMEAADEEERRKALDRHVRSLESHVARLSDKNYVSRFSTSKAGVGFVIMFVPNSAALMLASESRPSLWRNAMERRVYIADERTLYAALKIVDLTWQQIAQVGNHEKVYALAQEMLDRVGQFMESYVDIGKRMESARESYEAGLRKLSEGGRSIPATCRKLKDLGATPSRTPRVDPGLFREEG